MMSGWIAASIFTVVLLALAAAAIRARHLRIVYRNIVVYG